MSKTFEYIHTIRPDLRVIGVDKFEGGTIYGPMDTDPAAKSSGKFERVTCDIEHDPLPFADSSVDGVYCSHVLEHLEEARFVVGQMGRILRPGGILYLEVPGPRALLLPKDSALKRLTLKPLSMWDDPTHLRPPFGRDELAELVSSAGLQVEPVGFHREFGVAGIPLYAAMLGAGLLPIWPRDFRGLLVSAGWWNLVGWPIYAIGVKPAPAS